LPDGRTIGLGNDRIIYEMKPGAAEFTAIAATEGHRRAYFDEAAGIVRYIYANGALMELTEVVLDFRPVCSLVKMDQGFI